ncbi:MAG: hypothetical protein HZA32_19015 [Opitutae bacterium]|nr:hypothetical protein [Opitutae bacterium]
MSLLFTQPRSVWRITALAACVLLVALLAAWQGVLVETPIFEQGDSAVNSLQTTNAKHLREIYGNYSRFEFNHPGPAFFYVYAASEFIFHDTFGVTPAPHNAHILGSLILQVACFVLALAIVESWLTSPYLLPGALVLGAWHFSNTFGAFTSVWPPHVLLMPFLCFLAAACSVAAGRTRDVAVMTLTGGFLFHGHVAQPLFVGALGGVALFANWREGRRRGIDWRAELRAHRRTLWFCVACIGIFVLPLAIDVVRYGTESNVATILGRFLSNASHGKTLLQSFLYFLSFTTYATNQEEILTHLGDATAQFFAFNALRLALWVLALLAPAALFFLRRDRLAEAPRRFIAAAYLMFALTMSLCAIWGLLQAGPMYQFNGFFYYGVYYFGAVLGLGVVLTLFPPRESPTAVVLILCFAAVGFTRGFAARPLNDDETGRAVRDTVARLLQEHPGKRAKLLVFEHETWPAAAAVALELQRNGIPFYTAQSWNFMFGREHDIRHLGPAPENAADVWWLSRAGEGRVPAPRKLSVAAEPAVVDPRGATLSFGLNQNAFRHVINGLTTGNVDSACSDENAVRFLFAPKPTSSDVQLLLDIAAWNSPQQRVQIRWNGTRVGELALTPARTLPTVTIPAALWNASRRAVLELSLPDAKPAIFSARPSLHVSEAIRIWHMWFVSEAAIDKTTSAEPILELEKGASRRFTEAVNPTGDRLDFRTGGRGLNVIATGLGTATDTLTPITDQHAALIFRAQPATRDVFLEVVALPYTTGSGKAPHQRCQLLFNGQLIFDSPFTEPGVIRAVVGKAMWNARPFGVIQLVLPDATPAPPPPGAPDADASPKVRQGLALRWLAVRPAE